MSTCVSPGKGGECRIRPSMEAGREYRLGGPDTAGKKPQIITEVRRNDPKLALRAEEYNGLPKKIRSGAG
jgi:hypothetical protein